MSATLGQFNELVSQLTAAGANGLGCGYSYRPNQEDENLSELSGELNMQATFQTQESLDAAQALVNVFAEDNDVTITTTFNLG